MTYTICCENEHEHELSATELEDLIESGEYECQQCDSIAELVGSVDLTCRICSDVHEASTLEEANGIIYFDCPACNDRGFNENSLHVPQSWYSYKGTYDWMMSGRDGEALARPRREDYWEGLVHFCSVEEFVSILRDRVIRASATGYFRVPAVCLTDAPPGCWDEIAETHGPFGFIFQKEDISREGGGPACYIRDDVLRLQTQGNRFCDELKPFVNTVREGAEGRTRHNFLHEREWRLPSDLQLDVIEPYAIIRGVFTINTPGWKSIWGALIQYEELV